MCVLYSHVQWMHTVMFSKTVELAGAVELKAFETFGTIIA